jgi:hypothetical protein
MKGKEGMRRGEGWVEKQNIMNYLKSVKPSWIAVAVGNNMGM